MYMTESKPKLIWRRQNQLLLMHLITLKETNLNITDF